MGLQSDAHMGVTKNIIHLKKGGLKGGRSPPFNPPTTITVVDHQKEIKACSDKTMLTQLLRNNVNANDYSIGWGLLRIAIAFGCGGE
jgi:hypothetical protein